MAAFTENTMRAASNQTAAACISQAWFQHMQPTNYTLVSIVARASRPMIHGGTEGQTIELAPGTARLYRLRDGAWTETWTPTWLHGWGVKATFAMCGRAKVGAAGGSALEASAA